jgi:hypothetical protein
MAWNERHAAWQNKRCFAVTIVPEEGQPIDLARGLTEYLEAVELATEWLEREDPTRSGTTGIAISETRDGASTEVWRYPSPDRASHERRLVDTFGFDPVSWVPAGKEFKAARPLPAPAPTRRAAAAEPGEPPTRPRVELPRLGSFVQLAWEDSVSRVCLVAGAISLWLTLTLVDVRFLVLMLLAATGLTWRREHRAAAAVRAADDQDLL